MGARLIVIIAGVALVVGTAVKAAEVGGFGSTTPEPSAKPVLAGRPSILAPLPSPHVTQPTANPVITVDGNNVAVGPEESVTFDGNGAHTTVSRSGGQTSVSTRSTSQDADSSVHSVYITDGASPHHSVTSWSQTSTSITVR